MAALYPDTLVDPMETTLKEKFLKAFANVPVGMRDEIILVVKDAAVTWNTAQLEIRQETPLGKEILAGLKNIGILQA